LQKKLSKRTSRTPPWSSHRKARALHGVGIDEMADPVISARGGEKFGSMKTKSRLPTKLATTLEGLRVDGDGRSVVGTYKSVSVAEMEAMSRLREEAAVLSMAKRELDEASGQVNHMLDEVLEKDRAIDARSDKMDELMTRLELEAADLDDRIDEVERRESAAAEMEQALVQREQAIAEDKRRITVREDRLDSLQERLDARNAELAKLTGEAEVVLRDRDVLAQERNMLEEYGKVLLERESKLRESWDACARAALLGKDTLMDNVLSCDAGFTGLRRDAKLAEDLTIAAPASRCPGCARHETRLQRWALSLALESNSLRARAERLAHDEAQFKDEIASAKSNHKAAEAMLAEMNSREAELARGFSELEAREASLATRVAQADNREKTLEDETQEAEARAAKLASRERAVRGLERTWNDRHEDLVAREETTSKMQHRMARQREALELREADLLEAEERTRVELVELAAKRRALHDVEALLDRRQGEVSSRELDADALLGEAHKERELIQEFELELERKWERLAELAMDLEGRKQEAVTITSAED
jgi:hypothetical protein